MERENDVLDHLLPPKTVQSVRTRKSGADHRLGLVEGGVAGSDARTSLDAVESGDDEHDEGEDGTDPAAGCLLVSKGVLDEPWEWIRKRGEREQDGSRTNPVETRPPLTTLQRDQVTSPQSIELVRAVSEATPQR